jgi:hypothetical protein
MEKYYIDNLLVREFKHEKFERNYEYSTFPLKKRNYVNSEKINKYIYFLFDKGEIVYVGQTQSIESNKTNRPNSHNEKKYDLFELIQIKDSEDINLIEAFFIMKYHPFYNKALSVSSEVCDLLKYVFKTDWDPYKNRKNCIQYK